MTGVPIIDLDRVAPLADEPERRPGVRFGVPRPLLVAIVLLTALAVIGPARPPEPMLRLVLAAGGTAAAAFELGADSLYTASYGVNNPNAESGVRRFDLADGSLRWATALPQGVQNLVAAEAAGVLMARSGTDPRVSFLDTETGAVLWGMEAPNTSVVTLTPLGALITTDVTGGSHLWLADPRSGAPIWSRRVEPHVSYGPDSIYGERPGRVVVVGLSGSVTTLDFATGVVLSVGRLDGRLTPENDRVNLIGEDRMVVSRAGAGAMLTAYSLTPFAQLWRTTGDADVISDCGPVWCRTPPSLTTLRAIDPATGTERWQTTEVTGGSVMAHGLLGGFEALEQPRLKLLDPETGRVTRRLGEMFRVGDLLMHSDARDRGHAWVSVLDPDGTPHVLGRVDTEVPFGCEAQGRYLACPTSDGPTKVWRLPDA